MPDSSASASSKNTTLPDNNARNSIPAVSCPVWRKCCTKPTSSIAGKKIVTVEGLGSAAHPHPLQQAFLDEQAGQCGYCLSGILISAKALLDKNPMICGQCHSLRNAIDPGYQAGRNYYDHFMWMRCAQSIASMRARTQNSSQPR